MLLINGAQCGCCNGCVPEILKCIEGIHEYRTNNALAKIELVLDINKQTIENVIKTLDSKTRYKFELQATTTKQALELLVTDLEAIRNAPVPTGVTRRETIENSIEYPTRPFMNRLAMSLAS